eukprot:2678481-Amphidinium_carterae.1
MEVVGKDILVDRIFRPDIKRLFFILRFTFLSGLQYVTACRANLQNVFSFESLLHFMCHDMKKDLRVGLTEFVSGAQVVAKHLYLHDFPGLLPAGEPPIVARQNLQP